MNHIITNHNIKLTISLTISLTHIITNLIINHTIISHMLITHHEPLMLHHPSRRCHSSQPGVEQQHA